MTESQELFLTGIFATWSAMEAGRENPSKADKGRAAVAAKAGMTAFAKPEQQMGLLDNAREEEV